MANNERILIVEDEGITAMDIKIRLVGMGYKVVGQASTGDQALQLLQETHPDLVMMDIKLRGAMDGIETAEKIRSEYGVPVIYLTAFADSLTLQRAKITGPSGYILKPFHERELAVAIEMALYKHQMEKALRESEERYMLAIQGANDGIWDWDLVTNRVYYSPRWKEIIGYSAEELGETLEDWLKLIHPEDRERFELAMQHHLGGLTERLECEMRMLHKKDSLSWILTRGLAIRDENQHARRIAGSISDITALKQAQEQLLFDSYHDALTGIPNRALFIDRLEQAMGRHKRYHQEYPSVLFLDMDDFKLVNDTLGHLNGDKFLTEIARRLSKLVRASDTVARLGGDEFVILLEATGGIAYASNVAERVAETLKTPYQIEGRELFSTVSIGIVMVTDDHRTAADVLRDADIAMYRAKSLGKNRHEVYDGNFSRQLTERLDIENKLSSALSRNEFQIAYQPIYTFPSRQIIAVEALLRFTPQDHEPIPPSVFIPIAEEMGLIKDIGDWVLLESCTKMSDWHRRYPHEAHLDLHVNISVRQLRTPNFANRVQEILAQSALEPSKLWLEITENVFNENINQISSILEQLTLFGIKLMIDNFGTGYSSLSYIRRFPIDTIKLDRHFIFPAEGNGKNAEVVKAVLLLASQFGLRAVAAGIETEEQAESMINMKCHFGQGFLFSKPMELPSLELLFEQEKHKK